jgi:hypothetical protein
MARDELLTESDENENHNENDSQEELVIVEDKPDDEDDEVVSRQSADDDQDNNDDERAAIRERRRKEKLERKERKEKAITRDKLELDFLRKRNDDLERRVSVQETRAYQSDLSNIDAHYAQANKEVQMAERVIAQAVAAGNGDDVAQALRYRDEAMAKAHQLAQYKQQASQQPAQQSAVDDMMMVHAKEFLADNPWYDINGGDEDSAIVMAIDRTIAKEGLDPRSEEYWDELRDRVAKRLPGKFGKQSAPARTPRGGPAVGSGKEHAPTSTRKEIYISPERKQALVDAGVWDDPVLRMKYVKRYAAYDRDKR